MRRRSVLLVGGLFLAGSSLAAQVPEPVVLEGLVVTASPFPVAVNTVGNHVTVLDGDKLRARGIRRVIDALREVGGLAVVQGGSVGSVSSVFFRGGESDYALVLVDGVQVNQPGGSFDFSGLTTENVERIEIVRGPSSALHGSDAIAGVIHIISRDGGAGAGASLGARAGTFGTREGQASLSGVAGRASYALSLSRSETDGILPFNNEHRNTVVQGRAVLRFEDQGRLTLAARLGDRVFHFPTEFDGRVVDRDQHTFADESSLSLTWDRPLTTALALRAQLNRYALDGGTEDGPDGPADTLGFYAFHSLDNYHRTSFDLRAGWTPSDQVTWTFGGELERQVVRSFSSSESEFGPSVGWDSNARSNRALYSHAGLALGPLHANLGIRREDNERFGPFTSAQASVALPLGARTRVRAGWGRGVKEPSFFETYATGFVRGNPGLDPERSNSIEFGAERSAFAERLRLQGTVFWQSFRDLIQYTGTPPFAGAPNYFNVAEADADGIELDVLARLGEIEIGADWTRLNTRVVDAGFDEGEGAAFVRGQRLLRRPRDQVRATVSARSGNATWTAGISYIGERSDRDFRTFPTAPIRLPAHATLDLGGEIPLALQGDRTLSVSLYARNLLDERYEEVFGFAAPGRSLQLGGRYEWGGAQ